MPAIAPVHREFIENMPEGSTLTLRDIDWDEYESVLEELNGLRRVRVTYIQGSLVIMTTSAEHESWKSLFAHLVATLAEEMNLPLIGRGSLTLKRKRKGKGTEPDDCYYLQHAADIRGKKRIDIDSDPPPDLAIEVDITSPSLARLPIYAALGVPELWRFDGQVMIFYSLVNERYEEISASELFPFVSPAIITDFLLLGDSEDITAMNKAFRQWVQAHKEPRQ